MAPRTTLLDVLSTLLRRWQHRPGAPAAAAPPQAAPPPRRRPSGELAPLQTYLTDRYADTVVLTFDPDRIDHRRAAAGRGAERRCVVGAGSAAASRHTEAWTLAKRKATVNLQARLASFERVTA